jgi:hypothetical protein
MRAGRFLLAVLAAATVAGGAVALRRRRNAVRLRVDLYFEDGSMLTLDPAAPEANALFATARGLAEGPS